MARHMDAVRSGDPAAMSADYAHDAVIERPDQVLEGREAIAAYFRLLPERLAGGRVEFDRTEVEDDTATFWWRVVGGPGDGATGHDTCTVRDGHIVRQRVHLHDRDF